MAITKAVKELRRVVAQWHRDTKRILARAKGELALAGDRTCLPAPARRSAKYSQLPSWAILNSVDLVLD